MSIRRIYYEHADLESSHKSLEIVTLFSMGDAFGHSTFYHSTILWDTIIEISMWWQYRGSNLTSTEDYLVVINFG